MTALVASKFVGIEVFNSVKDRFKTTVIERWSKYRAEQFFHSFVQALAYYDLKLADEAFVKEHLDNLFSDELKTEVLYDAYRKVAFAASKTVGPRIIGILVARLVHFRRRANDHEEKILMAAELLNDGEFENFENFFCDVLECEECWRKEEFKKALKYHVFERKKGVYEIELDSQKFNSGNSSSLTSFTTTIDLDKQFGTWALKLKSAGLLKDSVEETERHQRTSHIDFHISTNETERERKLFVTLPLECHELFTLARETKNILATE